MLEVVAANSQKYKVGDRVNAQSTWQEYTVLKDTAVMPTKSVVVSTSFTQHG
jgi:NADPH-dependent curcumin reductase CurA